MKTEQKKYTFQFSCMTTPCEIQIFAPHKAKAENIAKSIKKNTRRLEKKYNFYDEQSFLSSLNNREHSTTTINIDDETQQVLQSVRKLEKQTKGIFDVTVGTFKQRAGFKQSTEIEEYRSQLKPFTGQGSWFVKDNKIVFNNPYVKLDLGGVIKEYAVDQGAAIARKSGCSSLINFGGDIFANGNKPDGSPFVVAIKNPENPTESIAMVQLSDQGLTTSAHYERSLVVSGKNYSHIIGDQTAQSQSILSATVLSNSVMESGVYSTALMLNPNLDILDKVGVILIDDKLRLHQNIYSD